MSAGEDIRCNDPRASLAFKALATPEAKHVIDVGGFYTVGSTQEEFGAFLRKDYDYQNRLMDELGLKAK